MSTRKIVSVIFIINLLISLNCRAQDTAAWMRTLRFGCDVSRFALKEFQPDRKALEFSFDTEVKQNLFSVLEIGVESATKKSDVLSYKSNGFYGRLGIDYNILAPDKLDKDRDLVFVGARYGFYNIKQQLDRYNIRGGYWQDSIFSEGFPSQTLSGHWLEAVFGLKVEVVKNLFLGASVRGKVLLFSKKDINYPYYMPGFGNGANKANFSITYSVYYQIPLMKVKPKVIKKTQTKK